MPIYYAAAYGFAMDRAMAEEKNGAMEAAGVVVEAQGPIVPHVVIRALFLYPVFWFSGVDSMYPLHRGREFCACRLHDCESRSRCRRYEDIRHG